jgi:hypothetical protein
MPTNQHSIDAIAAVDRCGSVSGLMTSKFHRVHDTTNDIAIEVCIFRYQQLHKGQ